jgi:glucose-1-phosphate thymidylyltransferase
MHAVILAGGRGKRLEPLSRMVPKPLVPVLDKPVINFVVDKVLDLPAVDEVSVLIRDDLVTLFESWRSAFYADPAGAKSVRLEVEQPGCDQPLGALRALHGFVSTRAAVSDWLVLAGDNLFDSDLHGFIDRYHMLGRAPLMGAFDMRDVARVRNRYGVVRIARDGKVIAFEEKSPEPCSAMVSIGCYGLPQAVAREALGEYLGEDGNPDAPGYFMRWLTDQGRLFAHELEGAWFDVGSLEALAEAVVWYLRDRVGSSASSHAIPSSYAARR